MKSATEAQGLIVYGTNWCPDCKRAKQFLGEHRIPYKNVDIEQRPEAVALVEEVNQGKRIIPTIVFPDGSTLAEPSNAELAEKLGLQTQASQSFYGAIVIGGGPTGLTAALYLAREGIQTLVIERAGLGGQAGVTQRLDNFPGFDDGISGAEFADRLTRQARRFGVEILQAQEVKDINLEGDYVCVSTADGREYGARAALLASGARYRRLEVPGEQELIGVNLHFCATCDGAFYRGKKVLVIGGGNSGFEEGLYLSQLAEQVDIVEFAAEARASQILQDKVAKQPNMRVILHHAVKGFVGKERLEGILVEDRSTGESSALAVRRGLHLHRAHAQQRAADREGGPGRQRLCGDRPDLDDQHAGIVRRRRCSGRFDQAGRFGCRRRRHGSLDDAGLPPADGLNACRHRRRRMTVTDRGPAGVRQPGPTGQRSWPGSGGHCRRRWQSGGCSGWAPSPPPAAGEVDSGKHPSRIGSRGRSRLAGRHLGRRSAIFLWPLPPTGLRRGNERRRCRPGISTGRCLRPVSSLAQQVIDFVSPLVRPFQSPFQAVLGCRRRSFTKACEQLGVLGQTSLDLLEGCHALVGGGAVGQAQQSADGLIVPGKGFRQVGTARLAGQPGGFGKALLGHRHQQVSVSFIGHGQAEPDRLDRPLDGIQTVPGKARF